MKEKNYNEMALKVSTSSRTIKRSGLVVKGKDFVVACGYNVDGKFGYFICWEDQQQGKGNTTLYKYSGFVQFYEKKNERTLHEVIDKFRFLVTDGIMDVKKADR